MFMSGGYSTSPLSLPSCALWTDSSVMPTGATASWTDLSGQGNHLVQATGGSQPTCTANQVNGGNSMVFGGTQFFTGPSALYTIPTAAYTMYVVAKRNTDPSTNMGVLAMQNGTGNRMLLNYTSTPGRTTYKNDAGAGTAVQSGTFTNTNYQIFTVSFNGTTGLSISVNNNTATTNTGGASTSTIDSFRVGTFLGGITNALVGGVAEIIIYTALHTTTESSFVNKTILGPKWGITTA